MKQFHEMQMRVRTALIACVVLGSCLPIEGFIQRTSTQDGSYKWVCREPKDDERKTMIDGGNMNFQRNALEHIDPIGFSGGCMPDATCDKTTGKSQWTNVFG